MIVAMIGSGFHLNRLAEDLALRGHTIHVIGEARQGPCPSLPGVTFDTYDHAARLQKRIRDVQRFVGSVRPDVVHSHYINVGGFMAALAGVHPHVLHAWGSDVWIAPHYSRLQRLKTALVLRSADWILSPAQAMANAMDWLAGRPLKNNEVLSWGVDTHLFAPDAEGAARFRATHAIGTAPLVLSARKLAPLYNQDVLLEAWPHVRAVIPEARLAIVRYDPIPAYEAALREQAERLGIASDIVWVESVPYTQLPAVYSACDVAVSIPSSDAPALTVLETMACGRPVVASDLPALREWVQPGVNGSLVAPRDPPAVARAILAMLGLPPQMREEIARRNRQKIVQEADRGRSLARIEHIYQTLAARGPARPSRLRTLWNLLVP